MPLGTYNGHDGKKRERVNRWIKEKFASGELPRPAYCAVCGQREGTLHAHHEDYDRPEEFVPLCITCHLMLHCRFRNAKAWERYKRRMRAGWQGPPLDQRNAFGVLCQTLLKGEYPEGSWMPARRGETFLDTLD